MSSEALANLQWLAGPWRGNLGAQIVEENWSQPGGGVMSTMVRLESDDSVDLIELIAIREIDNSLVLHLRQFEPDLTLRHSDDMTLGELDDRSVRFITPGAPIESLAYINLGGGQMRAEVTVAGGAVLAAEFARP